MAQIPRVEKADPTPFRFHTDIMGERTKKDFEMVIARYDEDISWSNNYADWRTVYNKGGDYMEGAIPLENKGHLADTILRHIITRYDTLAKVTFFCHGSKNYRNDQIIKEEGRCHRRFQDFIGVKDAGGLVCIETRFDIPRADEKLGICVETFGDVYKRLFGEEYRGVKRWGKGTWVAVGRDLIRGRPREFYERMLEWVLEKGADGCEPSLTMYRCRDFYIERMLVHAFDTGSQPVGAKK